MSNIAFEVGSHLVGVSPMKDGGVSLRFQTTELSKKEKNVLQDYYQEYGWLLFAIDEVKDGKLSGKTKMTKDDVPQKKVPYPDYDKTSKSQKLRFLITKYAEDNGKEAESYYEKAMDKYISYWEKQLIGKGDK